MAEVSIEYDVIIVGGGIAGLACAADLAPTQARILLLEARDRLGGRACTIDMEGTPIDVGCMMVHHRDDNPMDDLVRRSGLRYREYDRGPVARFFRNDGTPFDLTRCKRLENIFYNILDEQTSARAAEGNVDEKESVGEFVRQRVREIIEDEEERRCCELMLKRAAAYYGAPIDDIALRWYGFEQDYEGSDACLIDGYGHVVDKLLSQARRNPNFRFETESPTYTAKSVIVTVPLAILQAGSITYDPPLPGRRLASIKALATGRLEKIVLAYKSIWWEAPWYQHLQLPPLEPMPNADIIEVFNYAATQHQAPIFSIIIGALDLPTYDKLSDDELIDWAHRALVSRLNAKTKATGPISGHVTRWNVDPYSRGSYSYLPFGATPTDQLEVSHSLWEGRLGFAGEHTHIELGAKAASFDERD